MVQIVRLGCFVGGLVAVVLMYVFDWYRIAPLDIVVSLNHIPVKGWSGLVVQLCDDCPVFDTGGAPGGAAWLGSICGLQFTAALVMSAWQELQGWRDPKVTAWAVISALVLGICTLGVLATFDVPDGFTMERGLGPYFALAASALTLMAYSRLPDLLSRDAGPPPAPPAAGPGPNPKVLPGSGTRIPR
jgi:hypothetical protein